MQIAAVSVGAPIMMKSASFLMAAALNMIKVPVRTGLLFQLAGKAGQSFAINGKASPMKEYKT